VNDLDIKTLINSAVDAELSGHRAAPPWNPSRLPEQCHPAHPVSRWGVPVLAASVAALLAAGTIVAIDHGQHRRSAPVANSATPTPFASPSLSQSTNPDLAAANRAYAEAVAGAREATEVAGVTVGPLSAQDATRLKDTGLMTGDVSGIKNPEPGESYSFTLKYVAGPSGNPPGVLTTEVRDVASGTCAPPFLARPGHAYLIRCEAVLLAGVTGKGTLTLRTPTGTMSGSMNLTDPAKYPASPSSSTSLPPSATITAHEYAQAVAAAPEANKVAGVSDQPASGEKNDPGIGVGVLDGPLPVPEPGRSYPVTLLYRSGSDAPPVSVLAISIQDVAASSCPPAFRSRPNHSYRIRCQVTFRTGAVARAYYRVTGPHLRDTVGLTLTP